MILRWGGRVGNFLIVQYIKWPYIRFLSVFFFVALYRAIYIRHKMIPVQVFIIPRPVLGKYQIVLILLPLVVPIFQ